LGLLRFRTIHQKAQGGRGLAQGPVRLARRARLVPLAARGEALELHAVARSAAAIRTAPARARAFFPARGGPPLAGGALRMGSVAATRGGPPLAGRPLESLAAAPASVAAQAPWLERSDARAATAQSGAAHSSNFNQWQYFTRAARRDAPGVYAVTSAIIPTFLRTERSPRVARRFELLGFNPAWASGP